MACHPLRSLTIVPAAFRVAGHSSLRDTSPILIDHIVDDHSTIDAAPTMKVGRRTGLHSKAIITDDEAVAS
jgi:hypothetical protein